MADLKSNPDGPEIRANMPDAVEAQRAIDMAAGELAERATVRESGRSPIFEVLVRDETDLEGLVAYALYKQNKRDWLIAFEKSHGRAPDPRELASYILGERTPRRIDTYRRLAADALSNQAAVGRAPGQRATEAARPASASAIVRPADMGPITPPARSLTTDGGRAGQSREKSSRSLIVILGVAVVALVLGYLAYRFGGQLFRR